MLSIAMQCYASSVPIPKQSFFVYHIVIENPSPYFSDISIKRAVVRRLNSSTIRYQGYIYHACYDKMNDKDTQDVEMLLYTKRAIEEQHSKGEVPQNGGTCKYHLELQAEQELEFSHAEPYQQFLKQLILDKLRQVKFTDGTPKYRIRYNQDITTEFLTSSNGQYIPVRSTDGVFAMIRQFDMEVRVTPNGWAYFTDDISSPVETRKSLYTLHKMRPHSFYGMRGVYLLESKVKQTGIIEKVPLNDPSKWYKIECVRDYLNLHYAENPQEMKKIKASPQDDFLVCLDKMRGKPLAYLASLVRLVPNLEVVKRWDARFSNVANRRNKLTMAERLRLDQELIQDIGELEGLQGFHIIQTSCTPRQVGFREIPIDTPQLIAGQNFRLKATRGEKSRAIFREHRGGYYRAPENITSLRLNFIATDPGFNGQEILELFRYLNADGLLKDRLGNIKAIASFAYAESRNMNHFKKIYEDMIHEGETPFFVIISNTMDEDYNPYKIELTLQGYGSQMMQPETARRMLQQASGAEATRENILMGILAKMGAIPYILSDMPGDTDLFIGLDVGMVRKNVHTPGCAISFDKFGGYIGMYQPAKPREGEIIPIEDLQRMFDDILHAYEKIHGELPKHVVIHRDGHANEPLSWYQNYFGEKNIDFNLFEVIKSGAVRFAKGDRGRYANPDVGTMILSKSMAFLVTTEGHFGAPHPIRIEPKYNPTMTLETAARQIYYLTKIDAGCPNNVRLPITTFYADKICKALDYMPKDKISLPFFL